MNSTPVSLIFLKLLMSRQNGRMWQNPGGEVVWFREFYGPDAKASYCWRGPNTVEIRVWRKRKDDVIVEGIRGWTYEEWLDPHGKWHEIKEAQWCEPSKIITKEEALRMQIKELEPGVHVLSYDMDICAACKMPGWWKASGYPPPCPGW